MNRIPKHIILIFLISLVITLAGFLMFYPVPSPPAAEMANARFHISEAARHNAGVYSRELFSEARSLYDSAMTAWQAENSKFIYSRNYQAVDSLAELSARKAVEALNDSKSNSLSLTISTIEKIGLVKKTSEDLDRRFSKYPLPGDMRKNISRGEILISEAEHALADSLVAEAFRKISEAWQYIVPAYEYADANLRSYFSSYPVWKKWIDTTIAVSRLNQDYSVIVDKYSRKLFVYLNGEIQFTFSAELGENWVGDKRVRGDKATPEGLYRITRKLEKDSTQYYKALLLNYPNEEDTALFESALKKGLLPRSASPGGLIEIHGSGGKGADWTAGCIALTNRDMDSLFKFIDIGTPVTIVGSMYELRHVMIR